MKETALVESEAKMRVVQEESKRQASELASLRAYMDQSMPTIQTVKEMATERQKCEDTILKLRVRVEQVLGENSALQVRLKSINEILSIQEAQLETKMALVGGNEKKYHGRLFFHLSL